MYPKPCRNRKPGKRYLPLAMLLQTPYRTEKQRKPHRKHTNMEAYEPTSYAFFFCPKIEKLLILGVHLTAELLNDLIDRIVIHAPDRSSGHKKQKIEITTRLPVSSTLPMRTALRRTAEKSAGGTQNPLKAQNGGTVP